MFESIILSHEVPLQEIYAIYEQGNSHNLLLLRKLDFQIIFCIFVFRFKGNTMQNGCGLFGVLNFATV